MLPKNGIQKWYPNNICGLVFIFCKSSHGLVLLCASQSMRPISSSAWRQIARALKKGEKGWKMKETHRPDKTPTRHPGFPPPDPPPPILPPDPQTEIPPKTERPPKWSFYRDTPRTSWLDFQTPWVRSPPREKIWRPRASRAAAKNQYFGLKFCRFPIVHCPATALVGLHMDWTKWTQKTRFLLQTPRPTTKKHKTRTKKYPCKLLCKFDDIWYIFFFFENFDFSIFFHPPSIFF